MKLRGKQLKLTPIICLALYYGLAYWLPVSYRPGGRVAKALRYALCKRIFKKCGKNVNIERRSFFGNGKDIEIGDNSGLGINSHIPNNTIIGSGVLMGPNVYIFDRNHAFDRVDIPIGQQGYKTGYQTIMEDDIWIGRGVTITPGRRIRKGSVVGACTLLCKDFPEYSVIGGNPSRLIKSRI